MKYKYDDKGEKVLDGAGNPILIDDDGNEIKIVEDPKAPTTPADQKGADTPEQEVTKKLKEILPTLVSVSTDIKEAKKTGEVVKQLQEQLGALNGNLKELSQKVIKIGKKEVTVGSTGITREQKYDFGKFLCNVHKTKNGETESVRTAMKAFHEKYPTTLQEKDKFDANIKAAMEEGTNAEGGFAVPDLFLDMIWRIADQASVALRDATQIPLTTGYKLPVLSKNAGVTVSWVDEEGAAQESEPTLAKTTTNLKKMLTYSKISNELLEDEEVGLVDFIVTLWAEAMGAEIDNQAFTGDGTVFTGALNTSGVQSTVMATTAFANVSWDNMADADSKIVAAVKNGAKWYLHRTILNILRKIKDTNNLYIWQPPQGNRPPTIWDYPYELVEQMPSSSDTAANTAFILFGNMKYYLIGTKGAMTVKMSDVPFMLNDQTIILFRRRIAMVAGLAGALSIIKTAVS